MGLRDFVRTLLPGSSVEPVTFYRALISTPDQEPHEFEFVTGGGLDQPLIVRNEKRFQMPVDPTFVEVTSGTRSVGEHDFTVIDIDPISEDVMSPDEETVPIPTEFHDKVIPEIERSEEELRELFGE
jgi:hypothetical protein